MHAEPDQAHWRLALLLAGGGRRARMLAAEGGHVDRGRLAAAGLARTTRGAVESLLELEVPSLLERLAIAGWRWMTPHDPSYPEDLAAVADPPLGLFVRGAIAPGPAVAIVGSRRATAYGLQVARLFAAEVASAGVAVVSGMARGIDRAAHEGALDAAGRTWAVWGTGPDRVYPAEHARLAERIAGAGALVTEYPPGTPPRRHHFPERNRLIAGLVKAVVVVEAAARSGALVTAALALDEGREVLAVPGSVLSDLSVGPNAMLRLGARPAITPRDLLDAVGLDGMPGVTTTADERFDEPVVAALRPGEALGVDDLARRLGWTIARVTARTVELELEGRLVRDDAGNFRRREVRTPRHPE